MSEQSRIENWVRAAQSDDEREADAAKTQLVREFQPQLVSLLRGRASRFEDAEDLALETLTKAVLSIRSCQADHFRAWLWKIARRKLLDHYRLNGRRIRTTTLDGQYEARLIDAAAPSPEAECERAGILARLRQTIGCLPPNAQRLITDRYNRGLSIRDIADSRNRSVGAAHAAAKRADDLLLRALIECSGNAIEEAWYALPSSNGGYCGNDFAPAATEHIVNGRIPPDLPLPDAEDCDRLADELSGRHARLRDLVINGNPDTILRARWLLRFLGMTALYPMASTSPEMREIHRFMTEYFGDRDVPGDLGLTIELSFFSKNAAPALDDCLSSDPADWTERMTPVTRNFAQFSGLPAPSETDPHGAVELFARWIRVVKLGRPVTAALVALHLLSIARRVASFRQHRQLADMFDADAQTIRTRIQAVTNNSVVRRWVDFSELTRSTRCQIRV